MEKEIIREIDVQNVMTKSSLPVGGFSVNPYVGCMGRQTKSTKRIAGKAVQHTENQ